LEIIMKAIIVEALRGLDRVKRTELPDPAPPGAGAIRVRLHACSGFCLASPR
jgi:NADPH:quinone reductase-like Zn-dependent oxidoreductase